MIYIAELLENERKYIRVCRSDILKGKAVFLSFPCPLYRAVVNDSDAMLVEQRHLPLNMKL